MRGTPRPGVISNASRTRLVERRRLRVKESPRRPEISSAPPGSFLEALGGVSGLCRPIGVDARALHGGLEDL
jgi:hypothetical protein